MPGLMYKYLCTRTRLHPFTFLNTGTVLGQHGKIESSTDSYVWRRQDVAWYSITTKRTNLYLETSLPSYYVAASLSRGIIIIQRNLLSAIDINYDEAT